MFKHEKQLLKEVKVDKPNPNYANMMQEWLGGPHGELKAAMQYLSRLSVYRRSGDACVYSGAAIDRTWPV